MLTPEQMARIERRLEVDESVVWAFRPIPTPQHMWEGIIWGLFWCAATAVCTLVFCGPVWLEWIDGSLSVFGTTYYEGDTIPLLPKLGVALIALPFWVIGITILGLPLWKCLLMRGELYVITDRRALKIGRIFTRSWRASELTRVERRFNRRKTRGNLFFQQAAFGFPRGKHSRKYIPSGFENLPIDELHQAERAMIALRKNINFKR